MLKLMRRSGDRILIGDDIVIHVHQIERGQVSIGIDAPKEVVILRAEIADQYKHSNKGNR